MDGTPFARIGRCTGDGRMLVKVGQEEVLSLGLEEMKDAWQKTLRGL